MSDEAVNVENASLASQCLAIRQVLASQGQDFSFTLKVGSYFTFNLDTKMKHQATKEKKKLSPSTKRRNKRRRVLS